MGESDEEEVQVNDKIRVFFTLSREAIDDYLTKLILARVVAEEDRTFEMTEGIAKGEVDEFSVAEEYRTFEMGKYMGGRGLNKIQILQKASEVDDDLQAIKNLQSDIDAVREVRNKCVHGLNPPTNWEENLRPQATTAVEVVDELYELLKASESFNC